MAGKRANFFGARGCKFTGEFTGEFTTYFDHDKELLLAVIWRNNTTIPLIAHSEDLKSIINISNRMHALDLELLKRAFNAIKHCPPPADSLPSTEENYFADERQPETPEVFA